MEVVSISKDGRFWMWLKKSPARVYGERKIVLGIGGFSQQYWDMVSWFVFFSKNLDLDWLHSPTKNPIELYESSWFSTDFHLFFQVLMMIELSWSGMGPMRRIIPWTWNPHLMRFFPQKSHRTGDMFFFSDFWVIGSGNICLNALISHMKSCPFNCSMIHKCLSINGLNLSIHSERHAIWMTLIGYGIKLAELTRHSRFFSVEISGIFFTWRICRLQYILGLNIISLVFEEKAKDKQLHIIQFRDSHTITASLKLA